MKKRIFAILMAVAMLATLIGGAIPALAAEDEYITLTLHYKRGDANYDDWDLWLWNADGTDTIAIDNPDSRNSSDGYILTVNGDEATCTVKIRTGTMSVGFIFRHGGSAWEKDVDSDQFIDLAGILSGDVDFYVESGVTGGTLVTGDNVVKGVVVTNSSYKTQNRDGQPEVTVLISSPLEYKPTLETFTIGNSDGSVAVESMRNAGQYYYLVLSEPLDLSRGYNVTFEGREYAISMPDYYSTEEFEGLYTYTGDDLGATYSAEKTDLRVWAPTAVEVYVNLYSNGDPSVQPEYTQQVAMTKDVNGTWICTLDGDMNGTYYTYEVHLDTGVNEACDPYARTTGINGKRAMIIDLDSTDPEGWENDSNPNAGKNFTDAVIYELHVRDASMDSSSGVSSANMGKYLGLIEKGTNYNGIPTGLDHMVDLGITHVHLLPVYDINSVDETKTGADAAYNWGYDPLNYNVPEGSYSTDPYNGEVRVKEFKQMVKGFHEAGISVIMDVVYNHVANANAFCVNKIVPGYFSRPNSNGSGCGNDTASERSMVSKYIVDSVYYWASEYHIDGFRFDLVGLIDVDTINALVEKVQADYPDTVFYGEGWTMSTTTTKTGVTLATQTNSQKTPNFAYFSDTVRNLIKGGTYGGVNAGFISGASVSASDMFSCFKGMPSWCQTPSQSINYISCHDNNTLFDHISIVKPDATLEEKAAMNKLGAAFILSAQGIPFFQAGEEIMRSKPDGEGGYDENSYCSGDEINSIKWSDLENETYKDVYEYYKGLIAFRKAHPALRLTNKLDVTSNVFQLKDTPSNVYGYTVYGGINGEEAEAIVAIFNGNTSAQTVTLPEGEWDIYVNGNDAGNKVLGSASGTVTVEGVSAMILVQGYEAPQDPGPDIPATEPGGDSQPGAEEEGGNNVLMYVMIAVAAVAVIAVVVIVILKKKK